MEFKPPFINVTYHRFEYEYKRTPDGLFRKVYTRKRPGTVGICAAIANKYGVDAVPHLTCGGFTIEETEDALIDLDYLGVENVLVIRGDASASDKSFVPESGGHRYASELVAQIVRMNSGEYLETELQNAVKTNFCIGVAGYPEKHFESPNVAVDLKHLKEKVDLGAHYIVTQLFFDNSKYFAFVKSCREMGITVPIIPGLKPITRLKQLSVLPRTFHVTIPQALSEAIDDCKSDAEVEQVGIEWCIDQCRSLQQSGVPSLHFYTMGQSDVMVKVARGLV